MHPRYREFKGSFIVQLLSGAYFADPAGAFARILTRSYPGLPEGQGTWIRIAALVLFGIVFIGAAIQIDLLVKEIALREFATMRGRGVHAMPTSM